MLKRMIVMLTVTAGLIGVLGFVKFRQIQEAMAQAAAFQPPPEAVTTVVAQQEKWPATLSAIGTVAAVQGVTVSADLPGIVAHIAFESGASVHEGDLLVQLDTKQEQAQLAQQQARLAAVEAARELARLNFDRMRGLVNEGAITRAEYDQAVAEQKQTDAEQTQTEAQIEEIRATIARKTIRAPFSGILGLRQVNLGQYLSGGDPVVPLQSLDPTYVNFGVPQQDAGKCESGRPCASQLKTWRAARSPDASRRSTRSSMRRREIFRSRPHWPTPAASCGPECSFRRKFCWARARTAVDAAGFRDQLCAVRGFRIRRRGPQRSEADRHTAACASSL